MPLEIAHTSASPTDDVALVQACCRRDRVAERTLFRREYPRVNATLFRILGPTRDSEDLVQEVFVEVFRSLAQWRGEAKLSTWIDRIAVRVAWRAVGARRTATVQLELCPEPADGGAPADRRVQAREGMRRLYGVLERLGVEARVAFALHAIDGRPLAEVAKLTGSTVIATKVRVWRARREVERRAALDPVLATFLREER